MGLLDQVLGQVIGNMAGGQGRQAGPPAGGGMGDLLGQILAGGRGGQPQAGAGGGLGDLLGQVLRGGQGGGQAPGGQPPAPAPQGGGPLGGALGNILAGAGGKYSPLVLAVLAILANKHLSSGAGGLGSILHDMFGGGGAKPSGEEPGQAGYGGGPERGGYGGGPDRGGYGGGPDEGGYEEGPEGYAGDEGYGEPPEGMRAPPYEEPGRGGRHGRGDGGFLDDVGSMLDGPGGAAPRRSTGGGNVLGGGFDDLQRQFEQNGQGDLMGSWIGGGENRQPAPGDLERALGSGTIDQLSRQLGMDRGELLEQLSRALPQVVDGLTPHGRPPTPQEERNWI